MSWKCKSIYFTNESFLDAQEFAITYFMYLYSMLFKMQHFFLSLVKMDWLQDATCAQLFELSVPPSEI